MSKNRSSLPPFPDSERVIYERNPLAEVICQVRFPAILKIATELPAEFQERIRSEYPIFREKQPEIEDGQGLPPAFLQAIIKRSKPELSGYDFLSTDGLWTVGLTRDFLALSTTRYVSWEDFFAHLQQPLKALLDIYHPAFFTRVGLRYKDLIQRSDLGMLETSWERLLNPAIGGMLTVPELGGLIEGTQGQVFMRLPDFNSYVRINHLVVRAEEKQEDCFVIDNDFHTQERTRVQDVDRTLAYFNKQSGRLFRWCISEELHLALKPTAAAQL